MAKGPNETTPRQFRLTQETLDLLDRISAHYQLGSRADAIRLSARMIVDNLPATAKKPKNNPKKTT